MDCEQALALISAQIDREIEPADRERLEQHLADCPACRATADAFALQDEELRHTFAPRREAAAATAERVASQVAAPPRSAGARFVPRRTRSRLALVLGAVAAAACVVAAVRWWPRPQQPTNPGEFADRGTGATQVVFDLLTPRERPAAPPTPKLDVGEIVRTRAGERRRLRLPDGSVLYVDQNTALRLDADRRASLDRGTVFLEVAPQAAEAGGTTFVVRTPDREVKAHGTRFEVRAGGPGTGVVVTQGRVGVTPPDSPTEVPVQSGQQLLPPSDKPSAAPRASHVLDWTRDLMAAAESPLVPASRFDGGALIAVDPTGQEAKLALRKYHIDVHVEDGFARTTIDQTYFNYHPWRLEGTFYFPLPPDASLSRLAMYVDGKLMEGGMAERDYARQVYERIVSSQRDPALLEWVDGTTFKMRVFPLEGRQEKRIVLSYTQRLPGLYGRTQYRFPAGHSLHGVDRWSFHALVKGGAGLTATSPSHPAMKAEKRGGDLVLSAEEKDARVDRDVVVDLTDPTAADMAKESVRYRSAELDGARYLMLRFRPELPGEGRRQRRDWVILFESSADRDPLLARAQVEVVRGLLTNAEHDDRFAVLTAGTVVRRFADGLRPATPENVAAAIQFLERTHLVGTLDLGKALDEAASLLKAADNPYLVHVGAGLTGMGRRQDELVKAIPAGTRYVGVGVGKRWARSFMKDAAERSGGYFTQINPDEPVAWRAFDLLATLNTPRLLGVKVVANHAAAPADASAVFLTDNSYVCQGEELCACARVEGPLPQTVTVTGTVDGQPFSRVLAVADVTPGAGYLPRTWAKLEIERLLAEDARRNKEAVVALSKAMYVMTPFTSLLVLENEEMYKEFKVDRGRKDHWALYPCPERIPVVYEPDPNQPIDVRNAPKGLKPAPAQVMQTVLRRGGPRFVATEGRDRDALLGRLRVIVSKQERLRGETELLADRLGDREADARELGLPVSGTTWSLGVDLNGTVYKAKRRAGEGLISGRAGRFKQWNEAQRLAFSPDGRRLTEGEDGVRLWGVSAGKAYFFDGGLAARGEGLIADNKTFGWHYRADHYRADSDKKGKLAHLGFAAGFDVNGVALPVNGPAPEAAGLVPLVEQGPAMPSLLYQPLAFNGDPRLFTNLLAYAPGLDTWDADIEAVIEAEAAPRLRAAPGHIAPAARRLIERARQGGWQALTLSAAKGQAGPTLVFDGQGRYACERTLPMGLREQVVCDGTTLLHLYPELGVGARRTVSRFHRAELLNVVPWLVPPAEDLARGADLEAVDANTVAVVPHTSSKNAGEEPKKSLRLLLIFGDDGRLAERRLVETPAHKLLRSEVFDGKGGVRLLDGEGKELAKRSYAVGDAAAPSLRPDTTGLVVLPLPYRSREHVFPPLELQPQRPLAADENGCYMYAHPEDALALLATALGSHNAEEARLVFRHCFRDRGDRRVGFFVVLAACGIDLTQEPAFKEHLARRPGGPLVRYFTLGQDGLYEYLQASLPLNCGRSVDAPGSFLQRLARLRDLHWRWRSSPSPWTATLARARDRREALEFVRANRELPLAWALLSYVQARGRHDSRDYLALANAWADLAKGASAPCTARYERARCLLRAGKQDEAREQFQQLYNEAVKAGALPPVDRDFRAALQGDEKAPDLWSQLMRETAATLIGGKRRPAAVALAWQCRQLDDAPLADHLLGLALDGAPEDERLVTTLAVVEHLWQADQLPRAEQLVQGLLAEKPFADEPALWRLASVLADRRGAGDRAVTALERALDLEYRHLPDVIDLQTWRRDYGRLLGHYQELASALSPLHTAAPADLAARAVRAADRWRAHDPEAAAPCQAAARVLKALGARELAWEYQTTATGRHPDESSTWIGLARTLSREGDLDLAERAYAVAAAADPDNAQLLWDRAQNLRQAGRTEQAEGLFRTLAGRDWSNSPGIRTRARWQLESARVK